ncbi:MAG: nitroreductase family protein [Actinomycetota bacterium]|nr:nitroreductase family protein [Actinomycetota bacterium]
MSPSEKPQTGFDLSSVDALLTGTRAVRKRLDLDRDVDLDVVQECLRIALQAPTGSNMQRWRWVVVTEQDKKDALGDIYRRSIDPYHDIMEQLAGDNEQTKKVIASSRYLADNLPRIPVLVIPCHLGTPDDMRKLLGPLGYPHEITDNLAASGFYGSIWPAVWSFMLALRSRGLASTLTTMHLALEHETQDLLGIPGTVSQMGIVPVAHFKGQTFKPAKRRAAEEVTYWNVWKTTRRPPD